MALKVSSHQVSHQWKKAGVVFAVLAFFVQPLVALNIPSAFALGTTITVCASGCDATTIQGGVNTAAAGDTVQVSAGVYTENVTVNKAVSVVGAGASTTKIVATNANATPLTFSANNATVRGFTITHEYTPAELATWNFNNNGVSFGQLTSGNTLQDSVVSLSRNGVYINRSSNKLINNTITNNRTGINATNTIDGMVITGNTVSDNWTIGMVYYSSGYATNFNTVMVTGNIFTNNWYSQVVVKDTPSSTGTLDVTDNAFSDSPVTYATSSNANWNEPGFTAQKPVALGGSATKPAANYYPTLRIYNSGILALKHTTKTLRVGASQPYASLQAALDDAAAGDTIDVTSDLSFNSQQTVTKPVTIEGHGHTLSPNFAKTDNSNNAAIGVQADGVTINNLVEDGVDGTNLHGINIFATNNVTLNNVTVKNNDRSGVTVNASKVTVTNITTSGNGWHGVDVDKAGAVLTINGVSHHAEIVPQIYVDNANIGQVIDTNHQYGSKDNVLQPGDRAYSLKPGVPTNLRYESPVRSCNAVTNVNYAQPRWDVVAGAVSYDYQALYNGSVVYSTSFATNQHPGGTFGGGQNGQWAFQVRSVNAAGIASDWSASCAVTLDTITPAAPSNLTWKTSTNKTLTNNGATNIYDGTALWQDTTPGDVDHYVYKYWNDIAGNPYKVGNEYVVTTAGTSLAGVFNQGIGVHHFCVAAVDAAGNTSTCTNLTVIYDTTAPTITVKSGFIGDLASKTFSNVSFSLYDAYKADKYVLNGWISDFSNNNWSDANFANIKSHLVQGTNTLTLYDVAGNSTSYVFTYDNTAPVVTIEGATRGSNGSYEVTGTSDSTSPVTVLIDGLVTITATPIAGVWAVTTPILTDGSHTVTASSSDVAGNTGNATPAPYTFTATTPIVPPVTNPANNQGGATTNTPGGAPGNGTPVNRQLLAVAQPTADTNTDDRAVLGVQDTKAAGTTSDSADQAVKGDSDTKNTDGSAGKFFGLLWYWWIVILAAIIALWWIIAAARRRKQDEN